MPISTELADYIRKARTSGATDDAIKKTLHDVGWDVVDIDGALNSQTVSTVSLPSISLNTPLQTTVELSGTKSIFLNTVVKSALYSLVFSWLLFVLQLLGFMFFGIGGFVIGAIAGILLSAIVIPIVSIVVLILLGVGWKKIVVPQYIFALCLFSLMVAIASVVRIPSYLEYFFEIIGFVLSLIVIYKFNKDFNRTFLKVSVIYRLVFWIVFLVFIFGPGVVSIMVSMENINTGMEQARDLGRIMSADPRSLTQEELKIRNDRLDKDLDLRLVSTPADKRTSYLGFCEAPMVVGQVLEPLKIDSPQPPVCKDSKDGFIIYTINNMREIKCVDSSDPFNVKTIRSVPSLMKCIEDVP
jgi:hypothetical protein